MIFTKTTRQRKFLGAQFEDVKQKIMKKYKQVEKELLMKFREAGERDDIEQMQTMAETLSRYQNYQMCVDAYIEESVKQLALNTEIFDQIKGKRKNIK